MTCSNSKFTVCEHNKVLIYNLYKQQTENGGHRKTKYLKSSVCKYYGLYTIG